VRFLSTTLRPLAIAMTMAALVSACGSAASPAPSTAPTTAPATAPAATEAPSAAAPSEAAVTQPELDVYCTGDCAAAVALATNPADIACKVGVSWNSAKHPYGAASIAKTQEYAAKWFPKMEVFVADGRGDAATQTGQVDDLIARGIDVLIISPADAAALAGAVDRATAAGIKVIAADRSVQTTVSSYVGADNVDTGLVAGKAAVEILGGKGNVVELAGSLGASPTIDRAKGFRDAIAGSEIKIIDSQSGDYDRAKGLKVMEDLLQKYGPGEINLVFTHNDQMSFGAIQAIKEAGRENEIKVVGVDGEAAALDAIKAGEYTGTAAYPLTFRPHTVAAAKLCAGETIPERIKQQSVFIDASNVADFIPAEW